MQLKWISISIHRISVFIKIEERVHSISFTAAGTGSPVRCQEAAATADGAISIQTPPSRSPWTRYVHTSADTCPRRAQHRLGLGTPCLLCLCVYVRFFLTPPMPLSSTPAFAFLYIDASNRSPQRKQAWSCSALKNQPLLQIGDLNVVVPGGSTTACGHVAVRVLMVVGKLRLHDELAADILVELAEDKAREGTHEG
jgi:hypothetical protein